MNLKILPLVGLVLFCVLSLADLVLTWMLVRYGGGRIYEGNPIAHAFLANCGWTGLATFKVTTLMYVGGVSVFMSRQRLGIALLLLIFACAAVGSVVAYSWQVMDNFMP
jgi:hypothetical protein